MIRFGCQPVLYEGYLEDNGSAWVCGHWVRSLSFYGSSTGTHRYMCVPAFYGTKGFAERSRYLLSDQIGGLSLQQFVQIFVSRGKAAKSCPFCMELLFCLNGVFQIYYCMHVTFYSVWQHCDSLQRALMIRIDYFTMGSLNQALRLVKNAFQPCW